MTELHERPQQVDALPLGPESLVWRYFGDNRMYLIGPRPAVLQNMLAELGQGVLDHSVFFADTAARVKRSLPPIFMTVYGTDDDNRGTQVRDFHKDIKGDMPDGQPVPRAGPRHLLLGTRHLRRTGAVLRRHVRQAVDRRREGADLPRVQDLVPALRGQRSPDARRLRCFPTLLGSHDRRDRRRPSDRQVRRRLRDQGLSPPEGGLAAGVEGDRAGVQPGRGVPDHRRHAAANSRAARRYRGATARSRPTSCSPRCGGCGR